MRVALCQINTTIGDFEGNRIRILEWAHRARDEGAELAVFPEMTLTGYPPRDLLERHEFVDDSQRALARLVADTAGLGEMALVVGAVGHNPEAGRPLYNEAHVLRRGQTVSVHRKTLLPNYDVFDEDRYFEPAPRVEISRLDGRSIGVTICEDIWNDKQIWSGRRYRANPVDALVEDGARLLVNVSASPYSFAKDRVRFEMLQQIAADHRTPVVYVNLVGGNDSLIFDGSSLAVAADGTLLAAGLPFEEDLLVIDVPAPDGTARPRADAMERLYQDEMSGIHQALTLGLRDYARKCGFRSVVLGLSGGIDSAVTATLAVDALGPENVVGAFMPTRYTSQLSRDEAFGLAANLGIAITEVPIDPILDAYLHGLADPLRGLPGDATEENVQARIRGTILMAMSNRFGHLLLSTGNKSEIAVGYCTLYGDMAGGLAVISDLYKTEVYRLAEHLNRGGTRIPPGTIRRAPSAELKPDQRDQDTLPPYETLDAILRLYIDENLDASGILDRGYDPAVVRDVVRRIEVNEYKRQQAAPGLRVSWKAFGMGRRYPIARKISTVTTDGHSAPAE